MQAPEGFTVESVPFLFYVGTPAKPFVPRQGMMVRADYSAGASLQTDTSTTPSLPSRGKSTVSGPSPQSGIYLEVPQPVTEFLTRTPAWRLVAGSLALVILLIGIDKAAQKRRRQQCGRFTEPVWTPPQTIGTTIDFESAIQRLKTACGGNEAIFHRLIQMEMERDPLLTREEAAADALLRLRRDRD